MREVSGMKPFGLWFSEQRIEQPAEIDGEIWLRCYGCGKTEHVSIKAMKNGDTGWYVEGEVEPDETHDGVCGGSQFCTP
jgi:hypothetical protein